MMHKHKHTNVTLLLDHLLWSNLHTLLVKTRMPFCQKSCFLQNNKIHFKDITDIIANCASTHWADRKDGLIGLQCFFRDGRWVFKAVFVTMLILVWFVGCFPEQSYGASQTYLRRCSWTPTQRSCRSLEFQKTLSLFSGLCPFLGNFVWAGVKPQGWPLWLAVRSLDQVVIQASPRVNKTTTIN